MGGLPDPDWYLDHVLIHAVPGGPVNAPSGPAGRWRSWWTDRLVGADAAVVVAAGQGFVLTSAQASELGITRSQARTAVRHGRWTAPARGVLAPVRIDDGADRHVVRRRQHAVHAAAARLRRPEHVVGARSAAVLHGLPTLRVPDLPELLTPIRDGLGARASAHAFGAALAPHERDAWFGVPVTTVARTVVDLARHDVRDGIMAADAALRERLTSVGLLDDALAGAAGWPGVRPARSVVGLADADAESPLESLLRLALHQAGFPPPVLQFAIGRFRVDLCWPEHRLVVEADGRGKYTADELWQEKRREQALRAAGYRVERVLWADVLRDWTATVARLWAALLAN